MAIVQLLWGHTSPETAYVDNNYAYGEFRTEKYYWVETNKKRGDRCCSLTLNPKTGRMNPVSYCAYNTFVFLYLNEENLVKHGEFGFGSDPLRNQQLFKSMVQLCNPVYFTNAQEANIRRQLSQNLLYDAVVQVQKMPPPEKEAFKKWAFATANRMITCAFVTLADYPAYEPQKSSHPLAQSEQAA